MQGKKVLVVDDDVHILKITDRAFRRAGAEVFTASNGREALRQFFATRPDLIILDIMMPASDGWDTCHTIRNMSDVPIIMLTALNQDNDIRQGLDAGADDFVTKPFNIEVLLARARAVLRRVDVPLFKGQLAGYQDEYLVVNIADHRVLIDGNPVKLSRIEFRLLAYLVKNAGRVMTFEQILENVWGWEYRDSIDYVHVYVSHIRGKIEPDAKKPRYIITEHGIGYRFEKQH